jgi:hypothetical protein
MMHLKHTVKKLFQMMGLDVKRIKSCESKEISHSSLGEEMVIREYLNKIQVADNFLVEIGASDGLSMSNTYFLLCDGWKGFAVEYDNHKFSKLSSSYQSFSGVNLARCKVTPANIIQLLKGNSVPEKFGFLNLDIDSYDYFVLDSILESFKPSLVCAEVNEKIPPPLKFTVLYDPCHFWQGDHFYGMSISQLYLLCVKYNYALVDLHYNNAFLIPTETSPSPSLSPEEAYMIGYLNRSDRKQKFPWNVDVEDLLNLSPQEGLQFIDKLFCAKYEGKYTCYI